MLCAKVCAASVMEVANHDLLARSIPVHPLADSFPMMSDGELKELAEDIRKNRQREPAVFIEIDGVRTLIDGRHRLEACAMIGREAWTTTATELKDDAAIRAFIISHNVHRRQPIELILNFATSAGYRPEGPNPAAWSNLRDLLAAPTKINGKKHHAALPYTELPAFLSALRQREGIGAHTLDFTILTAARMGEVVGAQWSEIDLAAKVWTIPANRMKGGKEHRVPLSAAAIALLKALPTERGNDNVFIGARGDRVSQTAVTALPKRLGFDATVHGFRSTFADWAHERTGANGMIVEMCLAHTVGSDVERSYRRTDLFDKRRKLMEAWVTFATSPVVSDGAVVPMRKA